VIGAELEELRNELLAKVRSLRCRGACPASCERFPLFGIERASYPDLHRDFELLPPGPCRHLQGLSCEIYAARPMVCRLWGAVEDLRCPWGCVPELGYLTRREAQFLLCLAERGLV